MLDQLSLQLCLHSGLINMTADTGAHTHTHTWTLTLADVITCGLICIQFIADLSSSCPTPPASLSLHKNWYQAAIAHRTSSESQEVPQHTLVHTEKQRTNEAEVNPASIFMREVKIKYCFHDQMCYTNCLNRQNEFISFMFFLNLLKNRLMSVFCWGYMLHREQDAILIRGWCSLKCQFAPVIKINTESVQYR